MSRPTAAYKAFLATKRIVTEAEGLTADPGDLHPSLFPFQRDIAAWALKRGRAALFEECGLGKSRQAIEWARVVRERTQRPILIVTPLAVAPQFVREGAAVDVTVTHCREASDVDPAGINVINYDRLEKLDAKMFGGVVLDECFAAGTLIDTPCGVVPIESLHAGDEILNAAGVDVLSDVHRREVPYGVAVTIAGTRTIASPNHPWFTQRGWVGSRDLRSGDHALGTAAALRLVREGICSEVPGTVRNEILRQILLSEMADVSARTSGQGSHARSGCAARSSADGLVCGWKPKISRGEGAHAKHELYGDAWSQGKSLPPIERDRARTFRAWGQWSAAQRAAAIAAGCAWIAMGSGVCMLIGQTETGIPDLLQAGPSASREETRNRSGWVYPLLEARAGREERYDAGFTRVDGIEILEPGNTELERLRSPDGKLYFYDLGGTRHPSFSVAGSLVHNSSILKAYDSKTRNLLIESFADTPFKLACTATPAPNDHIELGNHAEFLGIMSRTEMLSTFFVHDGGDTQSWRLKGHAERDFWRWVCSWAVSIVRPSDLGYDNVGYDLPELRTHEHLVETPNWAPQAGLLFAAQAQTLAEQRVARRSSLSARVAKATELANSDSDQWIIWCDLNDESAALTASIHGSVEVKGADSTEHKEQSVARFVNGSIRVLVSKPSIFGFGVNLQNCHKTAFVGLSHSFEAFHQSVRRVWRFGQQSAVDAHIITSDAEGAVLANVRRKQADFEAMTVGMVEHMSSVSRAEIRSSRRETIDYKPTKKITFPAWLGTEGP